MMSGKRFLRAFTLIEILVVVSIIAVLAAMLLPTFMNMRRNDNRYTCLNNLHEIGVEITQYHDDYAQNASVSCPYPTAPFHGYLSFQGADPTYLPFSPPLPGQSPVYTGSNTDPDMGNAINSGTYAGTDQAFFTVTINATGSADSFTWFKNTGIANGPIPITTTTQALSDGILVQFTQTTGHTVGDQWVFSYNCPPPSYVPANWQEWGHLQVQLAADATASATSVTVTPTASFMIDGKQIGAQPLTVPGAANLQPGTWVTLTDSISGNTECAQISTVTPTTNTVSFATGLQHNYYQADGSTLDAGYTDVVITDPTQISIGNYGLAKLYNLYLNDQGDYVRSRNLYHCPVFTDTETVNTSGNVSQMAPAVQPYRNFDPLWSGYNSYDVTYNYNQFYNSILAFDIAIGAPGLDTVRQLSQASRQTHPILPADTVVCWCYGHQPAPVLSLEVTDPQYPDYMGNDAGAIQTDRLRANDVSLVLFVDGTVEPMRPYLMKQQGTNNYFWVPPYLYARGGINP
jgi:prepilin-type N-terminal cleavage/methylation domain-containing protein